MPIEKLTVCGLYLLLKQGKLNKTNFNSILIFNHIKFNDIIEIFPPTFI